MKLTILLVAVSLLLSVSACKKKTKTVQVPPRVEVKDTIKPEPVIVEKNEKPAPVVKQMNYYLVAGCFKVRENAERLHAQLLREGYDARILPYYNYEMVTFDGFETHAEAQEALNRIVQEPGKSQTWIYPVR